MTQKDLHPEDELKEDKEFFLNKLNITEEEFEKIILAPKRTFKDYPSNYKLYRAKERLARFIR